MSNVRLICRYIRDYFKKYPTRIFPWAVTLLLALLTIAGVSGTSIGTIYPALYGQNGDNPSLLVGHPQAIRSDEFLVNTQLTIVQAKNGFPLVNSTINGGRDMSIVVDVPYWDWSMILKPQNLAFFVMPLENAFAFKWWLLLVMLLVGTYYVALRITRGKILYSVLIAIIFSLSPFIWWWYQTGTNSTLYYGMFILLVVMNIIDGKKLKFGRYSKLSLTKSLSIHAAILSYLLACFAVILYPPFQIPIALVVTFASLGYLLSQKKRLKLKFILLTTMAALIVSVSVVGLFIGTRQDAIKAVASTVYPGQRLSGSGNYDMSRLLTTNLQFQLQRNSKASHYYSNASESSNFIVLPFVLLLPSVYLLVYSYRRNGRIDWFLAGLMIANILFTAHLLVESFSIYNRLFFLQYSPPIRAIIGYGLLGTLTLMSLVRVLSEMKQTRKHTIILTGYSLVLLASFIIAGKATSEQFPEFISNPLLIVGSSLLLTLAYGLIFMKRIVPGLALIALMSIVSIVLIHPLYRGLSPMTDNRVTDAIKSVDPDGNDGEIWGYGGVIYFENLPQIAKREAITGVIFYPNTDFWKEFADDPGQDAIYNRYAHVQMSDTSHELQLIQPDLYTISNHCNMDIMRQLDYLLSTEQVNSPCVSLERTVDYPAISFYLYKVQPSQPLSN